MAIFCKNCGKQIEGGAAFCPGCGTKVEQQAQAAPPPAPGQQAQYAPPPGQQQYASDYIDPSDIAANKMWGGLGYIFFLIPLLGAQNSRYARFHANQGLLFLILWVIVAIITNIITFATIASISTGFWLYGGGFGAAYVVGSIIRTILWIFVAIIGIIGLVNGFTGKVKDLPLIGKFRIIKMK